MAAFETFRNNQLKQNYTDNFILSDVLYAASNNEYWQDKKALWTVLSAACNEAGQEFYIKLRKYVQNLTDIDVCDIHSLVSLAKQTNCLEHVDFFKDLVLPNELTRIINLFSIKSSLLFEQFNILNISSTIPKGKIDERNILLIPSNISIDLIYQIISKKTSLLKLFKNSKFNLNTSIDQYCQLLPFNDKKQYYALNKDLKLTNLIHEQLNINLIFNNIENIDQLTNQINDQFQFENGFKSLSSHEIIKLFSENLNKTVIINDYEILNPFYTLLILLHNVIFQTKVSNIVFQTTYYDFETNTIIDETQLILKLFQTIQRNDQNFISNFVYFHIYGLFYDKLINQKLFEQYIWNQYIPNFTVQTKDFSDERFNNFVQKYISTTQLEQFSKIHINKKQCQVDFIQYLSLINSILSPQKALPFEPYKFNNSFSLTDIYNNELRLLIGYDRYGNYLGRQNDYISLIARQFTDLCIAISYARENIKTTIQQYTLIGTNSIITETVKDYFLKTFSDRTNWRFIADSSLKTQQNSGISGIFRSLNDLTNTNLLNKNSQFFKVEVIQYYDPTEYLNIYAELPSTIVGYKTQNQVVNSSYVLTEDYISTMTIGQNGLLSTIHDNFGFTFNREDVLSYTNATFPDPSNIKTVNLDAGEYSRQVQIAVWDPDAVQSVRLKPGAVVSTIIEAGNIITEPVIQEVKTPIYGLCADLFLSWNDEYWTRDFSYVTPDDEDIKAEIAFYELFYDELKMAVTADAKFKVYKTKIYPKLVKIYQTFATSGFAEDIFYLGRDPGVLKTLNQANSVFPTIASQININNLIAETDNYQDSILYLAKPFYEPIAYYINLVTKDILNMQKQIFSNGRAYPSDGWKQSFIEYKGYNSYYEQLENITNEHLTPSKCLDFDGPFVYYTLQMFTKLYLKYDKQIPWTKCLEFVKKYYFLNSEQIQTETANKLFVFQHKIFEKTEFNIIDFQVDDFGNQFTLYKRSSHDSFEDVGEIWVRIKNHQLSVPLMNLCTINDSHQLYSNDPLDTLQCNQHILYANMWKELTHNALAFAVVQDMIFILRQNFICISWWKNSKNYSTRKKYYKCTWI